MVTTVAYNLIVAKNLEAEVQLNWRRLYTVPQVQEKIQRWLMDLDATGKAFLVLSNSTAADAVGWTKKTLHRDLPPVDVLTRYLTGSERTLEKNLPLFAKIIVLLRYLLAVLDARQQMKNRQMIYTALPGIKKYELMRLVDDMAITLGVHPYNFLLEYEESGRLRVGEGIVLTVCVIKNVACAAETRKKSGQDYADKVEDDKNSSQHITYKCDNRPDEVVPTRIWGMKVRNINSVKVVIVCEHRNVGQSMWAQWNMEGVILVMTGGYPTIGTREFLAYLFKYLPKSVHFLWISDMDPNGVHMYSIIKSGCRRTAWAAAESMVCSSIELVGSKKMVIDQLRDYMVEEWESSKKVTKVSEEQMEALFKKKKAHVEKRMSKAVQKNIKPVITGMKNLGYLEHDEVLRRAVEDMENNNGCWSLSVFSAVQPQGLEIFLVNTACNYTRRAATNKAKLSELVSQAQKNMNMHSEIAMSSSYRQSSSAVVVRSEESQKLLDRMDAYIQSTMTQE